MDTKKLHDLIDKVIGKKGPFKAPSYWLNRLFKLTVNEVDSNITELRSLISELDSSLKNLSSFTTEELDKIKRLNKEFNDRILDLEYESRRGTYKYLTFQALEDDFQFSYKLNCEYSLDNGLTWQELPANQLSPKIDNRRMVELRAVNLESTYTDGMFTLNKKCRATGNCMSLIYGEDAESYDVAPESSLTYLFKDCANLIEAPDLPAKIVKPYAYQGMFQGCISLVKAPELPATTLAYRCYRFMFQDCTSLKDGPSLLPSKRIVEYAYDGMFSGCTSLITAPEILAETVFKYGCQDMFNGCTSLVNVHNFKFDDVGHFACNSMFQGCHSLNWVVDLSTVTKLSGDGVFRYMFLGCNSLTTVKSLCSVDVVPKSVYEGMFQGCDSLVNVCKLEHITVGDLAYYRMFENCTSLITAPEILAENLGSQAYQYMFRGCTSLVSGPTKLYAKILPDEVSDKINSGCCQGMFSGCTSLINPPELTATTLGTGCYTNMFRDCTSLVKAPDLLASTLKSTCYSGMFRGCTSLQYVKCLAINPKLMNAASSWLSGVSVEGKFIKAKDISWNSGGSGIPNNWVVRDIDSSDGSMAIEALEDELVVTVPTALEYAIDGSSDWVAIEADTQTPSINTGQTIAFRGTTDGPAKAFGVNKKFNLKGNIYSLILGDDYDRPNIEIRGKEFRRLFTDCTTLIEVSNDFLKPPAYSKFDCDYFFERLFSGCTSLTKAPDLWETNTQGDYFYQEMFKGCTSLMAVPNISLQYIGEFGCTNMFDGCTSITTVPPLSIKAIYNNGCNGMFKNCTSIVEVHIWDGSSDLYTLNRYYECRTMFYGCTALKKVSSFPFKEFGFESCMSMFEGCTSLVEFPDINLKSASTRACEYMFKDCTSLVKAPEFIYDDQLNVGATESFYGMFEGCTSLEIAPSRIQIYGSRSGEYMFRNCTSLVKAPELSGSGQYWARGMFQDCTSLVEAPMVPGTSGLYCYYSLFKGCSSLKSIRIRIKLQNVNYPNYLSGWLSGVPSEGTCYYIYDSSYDSTRSPRGLGFGDQWVFIDEGQAS